MKHRSLIVALIIGQIATGTLGQDKSSATSKYADLVSKIKAGDKTVDFRELRVVYADLPSSPDTDTQKKAMTTALNSEKYAEALKNADIVLDGDYADIEAHFVEYVANRETHNTEQSEFHRFVFQGLLNSIMQSGDGKSFQTAYEVVTVHEEYVVLRAMGLMPSEQSMAKKNGHSYDVMKAVNPKSNENVTLYFNIDIEEKHLKEALK
jgi:hypothetical protein